MHRRTLLAATILAALASPALAQTYPSRPINLIVPFPPGGNTDIMARALQNELGKALGQTVVIINKGGAAGVIGMNELVKAQGDGYTIALTPNNPLTAQPHRIARKRLEPEPPGQRRDQHHAGVRNDPFIVELDLHAVQSDGRVIVHHEGDLLTAGPGCPTQPQKSCSGGHSSL